jgi:hypothetical protein
MWTQPFPINTIDIACKKILVRPEMADKGKSKDIIIGNPRMSNIRVRLFSLSLTSTAFAWYAALPPNSINSWNELESKFHKHFFTGEYELGLADLASVQQGREESVNDYIRRFRDTRNRCFRIHVADKELVGLAFNGLLSYLRDKLDGTHFFSIAQLH